MRISQWVIVVGGTLLVEILYLAVLGAILGWLIELVGVGLVAVSLIMLVVNMHASAIQWLIALLSAFLGVVFLILFLIFAYAGFFTGALELAVYAALILLVAAVAGAIVVELTRDSPIDEGDAEAHGGV